MRFSLFLVFVILACLYLTVAQVAYEDCCLKYVKGMRKSTKRMVVSYRRQEVDGACNIPAIVLKLKLGRQICADPRLRWVTELMSKVDSRRTQSHASHKRKRSRGPKKWGK